MNYHLSLDISFRQNQYNGLYIALEGIDGCGKTTQAEALQGYFKKSGRKAVITSEPRLDLPGGEDIMRFFRKEVEIPGQAFQYWMTANRVINHEKIIHPALEKGETVISDRCFWSAVPYGLMDKGEIFNCKTTDLMLVTQSVLSLYHQFIVPDLIFYIDIDAETGLKRSLAKENRKAANDVYEQKDKLETVVRGYRWLVSEFPDAFTTINGNMSIDEITDEVIEIIEKKTSINKK